MTLTLEQQRTAITEGVRTATAADSAGGATITRDEAARIVGSLLAGGVTAADVRTALASPDLDATTRAALTAARGEMENALTSTGAAIPTSFTSGIDRARRAEVRGPDPTGESGPWVFCSEPEFTAGTPVSRLVEMERTARREATAEASRLLDTARTELAAGHFEAARAAFEQLGLPQSSPIDMENLSAAGLAAHVMLGLIEIGSDGSPRPTQAGEHFDSVEPFRSVNGMAARTALLADMERLTPAGSPPPTNPPSEGEIAAYLQRAAAESGRDSSDLMGALQLVESGSLVHYRVSDDTHDLSYGSTGYPRGFSDIEAQAECGGRRRSDCQLEAMTWFESARMAGMTPVGLVGVDSPSGHGIGHAVAVVRGGDGALYVCSGETFTRVPDGPGSEQDRIRATVNRVCAPIFHAHEGTSFPMHFGMSSDLETASRAAYGR